MGKRNVLNHILAYSKANIKDFCKTHVAPLGLEKWECRRYYKHFAPLGLKSITINTKALFKDQKQEDRTHAIFDHSKRC